MFEASLGWNSETLSQRKKEEKKNRKRKKKFSWAGRGKGTLIFFPTIFV
jgi:hypothetical protein